MERAEEDGVDGGQHDGGNREREQQFNQREAGGVVVMCEGQFHWTGGVLTVTCLVMSTTVLRCTA